MTVNTLVTIPESVKDNIFRYRFQYFLKEIRKPYSDPLPVLIQRIEELINDNIEIRTKFNDFLVTELSNGKNRQMFLSRFDINNLAVLKNIASVQSNLAASGLPFENFNNFLKDDLDDEELVYLNIERSPENNENIDKIQMCFYKEFEPSEDYIGKREFFTDYIWVEILTNEQLILIKIRPHTKQYLPNFHTSRRSHEAIFNKLKGIFPLTIVDMNYAKEVFYIIFKELTESAEQPYREQILENEDQIDKLQENILTSLGITDENDISDIKTRYIRLLERTLIISDLDNYQSYHENRIGIVERIALTDLSGASANVLSGDSDGLDVADFYFDIRETIDNMQKLDKLWVKWFLSSLHTKEDTQIEISEDEIDEEEDIVIKDEESAIITRFEVYKEYVIINFLKKLFVNKEVQDYVLSRFIEFEEKTSQQT